MDIQLGHKSFKHVLVVAEMSVDGVLGLDVLEKHGSKLDIVNRKLVIGITEAQNLEHRQRAQQRNTDALNRHNSKQCTGIE